MSIQAMKMAMKFCEDIGELGGPYPYVNGTGIVSDSRKISQSLRQAIEQAEKQEPVAWMFKHKDTGNITFFDNKATAEYFGIGNDRWEAIELYAAPPKQWVGLTDEELEECWDNGGSGRFIYMNIEAKLKEKNCG